MQKHFKNNHHDENKSFLGQTWEGISRFTWEYLQQMSGYMWSSVRNIWSDRVDFWGGATFITNFNGEEGPGISLGSFINIDSKDSSSIIDSYGGFDEYMTSEEYMVQNFYVHEYGHVLQSKKWGLFYLPIPGLSSLYNLRDNARVPHGELWAEVSANYYSWSYFRQYHPKFKWNYDLCKIVVI